MAKTMIPPVGFAVAARPAQIPASMANSNLSCFFAWLNSNTDKATNSAVRSSAQIFCEARISVGQMASRKAAQVAASSPNIERPSTNTTSTSNKLEKSGTMIA